MRLNGNLYDLLQQMATDLSLLKWGCLRSNVMEMK